MRINTLTITNFGPLGEGCIDFDALPSLVMVAGRLRSAGASSNGAGKSTIFNAMTWALFGREMRKRAANRVIRRGEKSCRVEITLTLDDGTKLKITRSRTRSGSSELLIDGDPLDTNTGAQDVLERRLGFSFDQFTRTVVFGGDLSSFCRMTPADRTRMLEELLGIGHFLEAADRAREAVNANQNELTSLIGLREAGVEQIASLRSDVFESMRVRRTAERRQDDEIEVSLARIASLSSKCFSLAHKLGEAKRRARGETENHQNEIAAWRKKKAGVREAIENADNAKSKALSDLHAVESEIETANRMLKSLRQRDRERVCPTCHRPLAGDSRPVDFKPHEDELERLAGVRSRRLEVVEKHKRSLAALRDTLTDLEAHEPLPPKETEAVSVLREQSAVAEAALDAALTAHRELCRDDPGAEHTAGIAAAMRRLRDTLSDYDRRSEKIRELEHAQSIAAYWQRGMARDGIPAMLLDSTAPLLNSVVQPLTDMLTDGAFTIRFTGGVTRGRADFKVEASNVEGGEAYEDLSKGELTRVDLCVLFAIRALMADRASLRPEQVFIDELFDGMDEQGMEYAARLLRSKKLAKQIVFISHSPILHDAADAMIVVEKKNGVARIR